MTNGCQTCPDFKNCRRLCPEAEAIAKQDEVLQRELAIEMTEYSENGTLADYVMEPVLHTLLSARELEVLNYLFVGKTTEEIAKILKNKTSTIRTYIQRIHTKMILRK
jgi:DNA-binding NarL/FixJ family response regulator